MRSQQVLRDFLRVRWPFYLIAILLIAAANVIQSLYPLVLGSFTNRLEQGGLNHRLVMDYSLLLLAVGAGFGIVGGLGQYVIARSGRIFEFSIRGKLFSYFTTMSENFYSKNGVGKLLSYVMNDVTAVRESITQAVNQMTNATILILSSVTMMLFSDIPFYLILVCIIPMLIIPAIVVRFGPVIRGRSMKVQEALGKMTESAEEQFGGIRVTKKFAVENVMGQRFSDTAEQIRSKQMFLVRASSLFGSLIPFLGALSLIISIVYGGYLTIHDRITLGNFVALMLYMRMMVNPLQQIGNVINTFQRSRASLERINELLGRPQDIVEAGDAAPVAMASAAIRIRDLTFTYPGATRNALDHIDLDIEPGKTLGILGKTGSGKTTLIKLLLRIYDPPQGAIRFDGTDIRQLTLESLRDQIAYVPQEGFLFSTTIRDNIAFFRRDSELDVVVDAAKQAQIYGNIKEFPDQFDTRLGERGITLSGGQRQRTSLARGLIKKSPVMILDDSVSAVDSVTEKRIIDTLKNERKNKTTIIIAHRISALKHADEIVVLDEGRIVQRGTHRQLLAQPGLYAELHAIQEEGLRDAE